MAGASVLVSIAGAGETPDGDPPKNGWQPWAARHGVLTSDVSRPYATCDRTRWHHSGTWSETSEHIRSRASLTERARWEACRLVGEDGLDVAAVADQLGVGWSTVMRAVQEYGTPLIDDPARLAGVQAVGVDETTFWLRGRARARSS